ncbi:hypothetical protein [Accumulibacter sp.]|uniref:hypothetical protein n=1 Tax=Accumulibacter sp. TaxID=2053492 RepID=UPI0028C48614|nr:hypothetical protein [Accumulibacter sp.]
MSRELAAQHRDLGAQRDRIEALLAALPSDARGGIVDIRAARFKVGEGTLGQGMVFTHTQAQGAPFAVDGPPSRVASAAIS